VSDFRLEVVYIGEGRIYMDDNSIIQLYWENGQAISITSEKFDTVIAGKEESKEFNGTSITAGYFVTDPNSKGEQNMIYYATFELGSSKIYLENSGMKDNSEATKNQLAEVIKNS